MIHEELLAKLTDYEAHFDQVLDEEKAYDALRAVVELHRPEEQDHKQYEKCWNCSLVYPCPTIYAIEKELG